MSQLSRLYIWSLALEPLLFFKLSAQNVTGVNLTLGRMLQVIVILYLLPKGLALVSDSRLRLGAPVYRKFYAFFGVAVVSGIYGVISGAYETSVDLSYASSSSVDQNINSMLIRPFFEYLIYLYYFAYFVILPQVIIKNEAQVRYFFSVFMKVFFVSFFVGAADVFLHVADTGLYVSREIFGEHDVGSRFHGWGGEPRDAFVYLFFGLAIMHLRAFVNHKALGRGWVLAIIVAAVMTQSASGVVGIGLFLGLYLFDRFTRSMSFVKVMTAIIASSLAFSLIYIATVNSERIMAYIDAILTLFTILESGQEIPPILIGQMPNIFPLYKVVLNYFDFNWIPLLIGSGFGSSATLNLNFGSDFSLESWDGLTNPHSQFVRVVYETGFLGLLFLYGFFRGSLDHIANEIKRVEKDGFIFMMLLLLGCFFGHRSTAIFIYVGILIAVFRMPKFRRGSFEHDIGN